MAPRRLTAALPLAFAAAAAAAGPQLAGYSHAEYVVEWGKAAEYAALAPAARARRAAAFAANLREIRRHNADPGATWAAGVNAYTDWDVAEFARRRTGRAARRPPPLAAEAAAGAPAAPAPASVDWRDGGVVTAPRQQGGCGSCWAFSTIESIESAVAIATGTLPTLSAQQLVDCVSNPQKCGGTGGCDGATEALGFDYVVKSGGVATNETYPYTGKAARCEASKAGGPRAAIGGYVSLPANNYTALLRAVATVGPVSVSVAAKTWQLYASGVYKSVTKDGKCTWIPDACTEIDHAVQLVGYGTDKKNGDYWLVRNSWGEEWAEGGYIRLARYGEGKEPCMTDAQPAEGSGCSGGPKSVTVCGESGILSDSSYPTGAKLVGA